jgi:hypothetical protein|nr:MAG TPA: hypothetical protein [Caudoviricetes sp.]DAU03738.1 MAG TPA: hypothetical protein [Caudoviricetes sp.]
MVVSRIKQRHLRQPPRKASEKLLAWVTSGDRVGCFNIAKKTTKNKKEKSNF